MRYGGAIFLIVAGAIVTFAVTYRVSGFNLSLIGVILMIAGAAALLLELVMYAPRRRQVTRTQTSAYGAAPVEQTTVAESRF